MSYRVCIPTAGTGSRLGELTRYINKSLVSIANRPTLSHQIEQFPEDTEFVIALGHKGALVREFLTLAYPERHFMFADVSSFEGPGSGLGLSLLACKPYLQQAFVFISCDTLVKEPVPAPDVNWMACAQLDDLAPYRTLSIKNGRVSAICEKGVGQAGSHKPYIGLAGIADYADFWSAMEQGGQAAIDTGEAYGLRLLLDSGITAHDFTWNDTGNLEKLGQARAAYAEADAPNILEKANEAIWFVDRQVIKFSDDQKFIANRALRAHSLQGYVPEVTAVQPHMYSYPKAQGRVLSELITLPLFEKLLSHSKGFWIEMALNEAATLDFNNACKRFYRDKTYERVELFYKNFSRRDGTESINGLAMPALDALLGAVDWDWLSQGVPVRFHGDFHFENILWNDTDQKFTFLDWRQDFAGDIVKGDIYYDFAKLLHGMIISHEIIANDQYSITWHAQEISYDFHRKQILVECERYFENWVTREGYDRKKTSILTALIYLNIAALHHYPYSLLLYSLGKKILENALEN